jgi:hypothetical protein
MNKANNANFYGNSERFFVEIDFDPFLSNKFFVLISVETKLENYVKTKSAKFSCNSLNKMS